MRRLLAPAALAAVVLVAVGCWVWFRLFTGIRLEDALITWRYARHLAAGDGFVFNPGERVLGTTTPLLTLMLGLGGAVAGADRVPLLANVLMMIAGAGAGVMTCLALEALGVARGVALFAAAALMLNPQMLWMASGGMETPLVLLLMAWGLWAVAARRPGAAGASAALLAITRIDGLVWAAGVLVCAAIQGRVAARRALIWFAALAIPWLVFAFAYFGSPIPNSVIAKRVIGNDYDVTSLAHLKEHLIWNAPFFGWSIPFLTLAGCAAFVAGSVCLVLHRRRPEWLMLVVFPVVFSALLYLGRAPIWFDWYLAPVGWTALLVGVAGCGAWRARLARLPRRWIVLVVAGAAVYFGLLAVEGRRMAVTQRDYQINEDGCRRVVGEWLKDHTPPNSVVAMEAVGYQAYYADRKVIDLAGLVSPQVIAIRKTSRSNAEAFSRVLHELAPGYLVLRSFEVDRNAHYHGGPLFESSAQTAYFATHYEEAQRFEAPLPRVWGPTSYLTVYRRLPER